MVDRLLRSSTLRGALYSRAGGQCQMCGEPLERGWHADHEIPWAITKNTNVHGMLATCPSCNAKKGDQVMLPSGTVLRDYQKGLVRTVLEKARRGDRITVAYWAPGAGKTVGYIAAAYALWKEGYIDGVVVFTPRLNLTFQAESDWAKQIGDGDPGPLHATDNTTPLLTRKDFGYASTYQALHSQPRIHEDEIKRRRYLLVADEWQVLGDENTSTSSLERVADPARFVLLMTGTPYRDDDQTLVYAEYTHPDAAGRRFLRTDSEVGVSQCIEYGYLRRFDFELIDGVARFERLGHGYVETSLSGSNSDSRRRALLEALGSKDYWPELAKRVVYQLEVMRADSNCDRLQALIGARDQPHARQIQKYLGEEFPHLKTSIAISDEYGSHETLDKFRRGHGDILVTVGMAHVGYDNKYITVIGCLNNFRTEGWLRQFFARAMRPIDEIPLDSQVCHAIVPDDPMMAEFCERLRQESERGLRERLQREGQGRPLLPEELVISHGAEFTTTRIMGDNPEGDIQGHELALLREGQRRAGLQHIQASKLAIFMRSVQTGAALPVSESQSVVPEKPFKPKRQAMREYRRETSQQARKVDKEKGWEFGTTEKLLYDKFGPVENIKDWDTLKARYQFVKDL